MFNIGPLELVVLAFVGIVVLGNMSGTYLLSKLIATPPTGAAASVGVMLVLIGPDWLTTSDETGRPRLENAEDFVRVEVAQALGGRDGKRDSHLHRAYQ